MSSWQLIQPTWQHFLPPLKPLKSITDLEESNYNVSTFCFFKNYFCFFDNPLLSKLNDTGRLSFDVGDIKNLIDQVRKLLEDEKAFIGMSPELDFIQKCIPEAYVLDVFITFETTGFAMRKDRFWVYTISKLFIKYGHSGIFHKVLQKYEENNPTAQFHPTPEIRISGFRFIIILMILAALLSLILSILALCKSKHEPTSIGAFHVDSNS